MTEAKRDENSITVILATSSTDGSTPVPIKVDPTNHAIKMEDGVTGSDLSGDLASRDDNVVTVMMGVSSDDGVTPTAIYANESTGALLIQSS